MDEKINEKQVADLIAILRADASVDAKVQQIGIIKTGIKHHNVPDNCVAGVFEALRTASASQHAALTSAGFTTLIHLFTRLSLQEPKYLIKEAPRTLPLIVEKLGDQKDKYRALAAQALTTLWKVAPTDVERALRNTAMAGKNPRAKEASMQWILQMHQESGLQFRAYVPSLMELLEDADGMVRENAKSTVIELFKNAPNAAKSDLKRQLKIFKVRPQIEQAVVKALAPTSDGADEDTATEPSSQQSQRSLPSQPARPNLSASVSSMSSERPITPMLDSRAEQVEPSYVNTPRELDDIFKEMHTYFEGRETEQNWLKREESMTKLRRLMAGNATTDFPEPFFNSLRGLMDGIIKATTSLRTSLCKEGCSLIQDIAVAYGPAMDPMVEILLQMLIKLSAGTKKISSGLANTTVDTIVGRVTYNTRILQHIWATCQDKNVQPRAYATGWLKTLLLKEAHHKAHVEHTGGLEIIEKCIKKGLVDPNPGVRERMRATYWTFNEIWPARAEAIMNGLESTAQRLLQNDANNPNSPKKADVAVRPGLGLSKSTLASGKPSLREAMLAQKKAALAAKTLPPRPGSAMSSFSPARTVSNSSTASSSSTGTTVPHVRTRPESTIAIGSGGMSVAPVRPMKKRVEMVARPATAGPYSVRSHDQPSSEQLHSPESSRPRSMITKAGTTVAGESPKRTVTRGGPRLGHVAHSSEGSIAAAPSRVPTVAGKTAASPRASPARPRLAPPSPHSPSSRANEHMTMVVPSIAGLRASGSRIGTPPRASSSVPEGVDDDSPTASVLKVYEDPFTSGDQTTPKPQFNAPVLEDRPVNEDAANLARAEASAAEAAGAEQAEPAVPSSPEKARQNSRLLDSGIARIRSKALDVHGFRKLQSLMRDSRPPPFFIAPDDKFDALVLGLFEYLEAPASTLAVAAEKAQDVKAQILATLKLLLKKNRDGFQPHVSRGLEALLATRAGYDGRTHIVAGLELLADELAALGDASEMVVTLTRMLSTAAATAPQVPAGSSAPSTPQQKSNGAHFTASPALSAIDAHQPNNASSPVARTLSMGMHVLRSIIESRAVVVQPPAGSSSSATATPSLSNHPAAPAAAAYSPSPQELAQLAQLATACLDSADSAVRMDAVQLCVALHAKVGDAAFWKALGPGVKEDPKSLITYYVVKRQREREREQGAAAVHRAGTL